jgi:hypothetical protein
LAPGMSTTLPVSNRSLEMTQFLTLGFRALSWCVGLLTIAWFAVWMGLTSKKINLALLKTFCYAKFLPWLGLTFVGIFLLLLIWSVLNAVTFLAAFGVYLYPVIPELLFLAANFILIAFARRRARIAFSEWPNLTAA